MATPLSINAVNPGSHVIAGDPIVQAVLYLLAGISLLTWFIIAYKGLELLRIRRTNKAYLNLVATDPSVLLRAQESPSQSPLSILASSAVSALNRYQELPSPDETLTQTLTRALRQSIQDLSLRFESGLGLLATIGNTAPFIGLFGTVVGMMFTLQRISESGSTELSVVAGPIGEALIATAAGIACAIPAVVAYNSFLRRSRVLANTLDSFAYDVLHYVSHHPQATATSKANNAQGVG